MPQDEPTFRGCPSVMGGMNGAWTGSSDAQNGLFFAPSIEACQTYQKGLVTFVKGIPFMGGLPNPIDGIAGKSYGLLTAIDVKTGKVAWRYHDSRPMMGGVVSTAGGVLFTSNMRGEALAFDQATGEKLWSFQVGGAGRGQPIVYQIDGKTTNKEEFVTCGGVTLKEVDFQTMQSKICPKLFFAGEILDIDGVTGGFNFQNAWTTSFIAGQND